MGNEAAAAVNQQLSFFQMVTGSGPVVLSVLIILIALSVFSWAIAISKYFHFRDGLKRSNLFERLFWDSREQSHFARLAETSDRMHGIPSAELFNSGYREFLKGSEPKTVERVMRKKQLEVVRNYESGMTFLATVASAAPFIGLFGTVWGIMNAFHQLGFAKSSTIQAVAPGISEALVATAVGLAAAIPAAVAYNFFVASLKHVRSGSESFISDFMALVGAAAKTGVQKGL